MRRVTQPFIYTPPPTPPIPAIYRHVSHKQRCTSVWHSNGCIVLASVKPDTLWKPVHHPSFSHSFSLIRPKLSLGSPASLHAAMTSSKMWRVMLIRQSEWWNGPGCTDVAIYSTDLNGLERTNWPMEKDVWWHSRCCGAFWSACFGTLGQPSFSPLLILSGFSHYLEICWFPYLKHQQLLPTSDVSLRTYDKKQEAENPFGFMLTHTMAPSHTPLFVQSTTGCSHGTRMINSSRGENNLHPSQGFVLIVRTTLHVWFQIQPMWAVTCEAPPPGWLPASPKVRESNKKPGCPPPSTPKLSVRVPLGEVPRKWLWWVAVAAAAIFSGLAARRGEEGNV